MSGGFFSELDSKVKSERKMAQDKVMTDLTGGPLRTSITKPSLVPSGLFAQRKAEDKASASIYHLGDPRKADNIYLDKNLH
jgi:hypothetical protein